MKEAIADLRTALAYAHDRSTVRLRLAEALAADGQIPQARAYLLALWDEVPGDGTVSLELARLAARSGDLADAQRYFHGAIYGIWEDDPIRHRRDARLELIEFLLARRALAQAESELVALAADLPDDAAFVLSVGRMFLQAGDPGRASVEFRVVAQKEPRNAAAWAGAGQAAFQQENYSEAGEYLGRAVALDSSDQRSAELLATTSLILQMDPFVARIGHEERNRRVLRALDQTQHRIEQCSGKQRIALNTQPTDRPIATDYRDLSALSSPASKRSLRVDPDLADAAMDLVFRSQSDAAAICGQPEGPDLALLLIGRLNGRHP